ncbi:hypothetical protein GCM10029963_24370 [Micromonospora andamanensis]
MCLSYGIEQDGQFLVPCAEAGLRDGELKPFDEIARLAAYAPLVGAHPAVLLQLAAGCVDERGLSGAVDSEHLDQHACS